MRLSRQLWVVEAGIFLSMLGYGAVFPFEIVYLHEERGFGLGLAGIVVGLLSAVAVVVAPVAGAVIDRVGARPTAVWAGLALAGGYGLLAFATTPAVAIAAAVLAGVGNGALQPSQSALMAALAPRELLQRASGVSRVAVNVGLGLGAAIGGVVAGAGAFVALFLANAVTYLVYLAILAAAVRDQVRPEPVAGGYRAVLRDRALRRFALVNVALIAVGWGVLAWIVPPYARAIGIAPSLIGLLILANAATVVVAQLPIVRAAEGRSRVGVLSLAAAVWVARLPARARGRLPLAARRGGRVRGRRVPARDGVHAADRRPRAARPARALYGDRGPVVVAGTGGRADPGRAAPGGVAGAAAGRRRGAGGVGDRAAAGRRARAAAQSARDTSSHTARCSVTFASRSVWTATMLVRSAARAPASARRNSSTSAATT